MIVWSGQDPEVHLQYGGRNEPYAGCLFAMNIGRDTESVMTQSQKDLIKVEVDNAHSDGRLVMYVFDSMLGVSQPPSFVETIEDMDFPVLALAVFGQQAPKLQFRYRLYEPNGKKEFSNLTNAFFRNCVASWAEASRRENDRNEGPATGPVPLFSKFKFDLPPQARMFGFATVDNKKVFIPPINV